MLKLYTLDIDPLLNECDKAIRRGGNYVAVSVFDSYQHFTEILSICLGLVDRRRLWDTRIAQALVDYGHTTDAAVECIRDVVAHVEGRIERLIQAKIHYSTHQIEIDRHLVVVKELGYQTICDTRSYPALASIVSEVLYDDDCVWQSMSVDELVNACRTLLPTIKHQRRRVG